MHTNQFHSARDAKEFLVGQIVEEADLEGIPLEPVERRMLYFPEAEKTPLDFDSINDTFERQYGDKGYEKKIRKLIRNARERARASDGATASAWNDAVSVLKTGDHYLLVMLGDGAADISRETPWRAVLLFAAFSIGFGTLAAAVSSYMGGRDIEHNPNVLFVLWAVPAAVTGIYLLLRLIFGSERPDNFLGALLSSFTRFVDRLIRR
jgi:hypothetical protein